MMIACSLLSAGGRAGVSMIAGDRPHSLSTSWRATDGFENIHRNSGLPQEILMISFEQWAYEALRDDEQRTPLFVQAIEQRLEGKKLTVLDIGTGPYALLAMVAARAGATHVHAIEVNPRAAASARQAVSRAEAAGDVPKGSITIHEGLSTAIDLDVKVDLVVAEIVGSVSSEEALHATICDAQARLVARPHDPASYIPCRAQTLAAPAAYSSHAWLDCWQEEEEVEDAHRALRAPVRVKCEDGALRVLAEPQLLEDIGYADIQPGAGVHQYSPLHFTVCGNRLDDNRRAHRSSLQPSVDDGGLEDYEADELAQSAACTLSGIAMWPRLELDPEAELVVETRASCGGLASRPSSWSTVLPILPAVPPLQVDAGDKLTVTATVELGSRVDTPPRYTLGVSFD